MALLKEELQGFVPVEIAPGIMKNIARGSSILRLAKVEPMESDTKQFQVLAEGPGAYWVEEGKRIQTSKARWIFPEMKAKKIAVIIPVTKEKLKDTTIDVFGELKDSISEAMHQAIDAACLFGTSSPFAKNIFDSAVAAGNFIVDGTSTLDLDVSDVMAKVEETTDVNGFVAHNGMKNRLRKLRDANGNQLFINGTDTKEFYNEVIEFVRSVAWDKTKADVIAADWSKALVGIRDNLEYEILTEATLQGVVDADGKPISLAEQDLIGLKVTMRLGFLPIKDDAFSILATKGTTPTVPAVQEMATIELPTNYKNMKKDELLKFLEDTAGIEKDSEEVDEVDE